METSAFGDSDPESQTFYAAASSAEAPRQRSCTNASLSITDGVSANGYASRIPMLRFNWFRLTVNGIQSSSTAENGRSPERSGESSARPPIVKADAFAVSSVSTM